jgi:hypothetical protein
MSASLLFVVGIHYLQHFSANFRHRRFSHSARLSQFGDQLAMRPSVIVIS